MYKVIRPSGLLDGQNANQLRQDITNILSNDITTIILDFEQVTFINSSAIGALVALLKNIRSNNKELIICSLNEQIKMIFELTRMEQVFKIVSDLKTVEEKFQLTASQ